MSGSSYLFPKTKTVTEIAVYGLKIAPIDISGTPRANWIYKSETKAVVVSKEFGIEFEVSIIL